jgi:hypothetical protein
MQEAAYIVVAREPGRGVITSDVDRVALLQVRGKASRMVVSHKWLEDCTSQGVLLGPRVYRVDFVDEAGPSEHAAVDLEADTPDEDDSPTGHDAHVGDVAHDLWGYGDNDDLAELRSDSGDPTTTPGPNSTTQQHEGSYRARRQSTPEDVYEDPESEEAEHDSDNDEYRPTDDIGPEHLSSRRDSVPDRHPPAPEQVVVKSQKPMPQLAAHDEANYNWLKEVLETQRVRSRVALFTELDHTVSLAYYT